MPTIMIFRLAWQIHRPARWISTLHQSLETGRSETPLCFAFLNWTMRLFKCNHLSEAFYRSCAELLPAVYRGDKRPEVVHLGAALMCFSSVTAEEEKRDTYCVLPVNWHNFTVYVIIFQDIKMQLLFFLLNEWIFVADSCTWSNTVGPTASACGQLV